VRLENKQRTINLRRTSQHGLFGSSGAKPTLGKKRRPWCSHGYSQQSKRSKDMFFKLGRAGSSAEVIFGGPAVNRPERIEREFLAAKSPPTKC
jgi:hypothetical protein